MSETYDESANLEVSNRKSSFDLGRGAENAQSAISLRPLRKVDLSKIKDAESVTPESVLEGLIWRDVVTLFGAHGGAGKSSLSLVWAVHVALGEAWAGVQTMRCKVLYVTLEDPETIVLLRIKRICDYYDFGYDDVQEWLEVQDGTDWDTALVREKNEGGVRTLVATEVFRCLEDVAPGNGLIIVDNSSDAYAANENERSLVRTFIRKLTQLAKNNRAAVLLLAHIDKAAARGGPKGDTYSGSTAWHNSVRSRLALVPKEDDVFELRHEKCNLGPKLESIEMEWHESIIVPRRRDRVAEGIQDNQRLNEDAGYVLDVIRVALEAGDAVTAAMSGNAQVYHVLQRYEEMAWDLTKAANKRRVNAAVTRLIRDKRISKVEVRDHNRNKKTVLQLTQGRPLEVVDRG